MIVKKAVNMANMMNVPILGLVENMSYAVCDHFGHCEGFTIYAVNGGKCFSKTTSRTGSGSLQFSSKQSSKTA